MAIAFSCPHCGAAQNAEDRFAGLAGPCTACGKTLTVPLATSGVATAAKVGAGMSIALIFAIGAIVVLLACGGLLVALLLPAIGAARTAARRTQSANNERAIMVALLSYESQHREFPPAVVYDDKGKPMHSWRVLILPHLESQHLYAQYDFNEPWDSPKNKLVAQTMPAVFRSPLDPAPKSANTTSYLLFTGKGTFWDGKGPFKVSGLQDGVSNTLAMVEVDNSGVVWTQPQDLDAEKLDFKIRDMKNAQPGQINSAVPGGTMAVTFDSFHHFISREITVERLRSAIDPADGKVTQIDP